MNRLPFLLLIVIGLITGPLASAHDPSKHKGKATFGEIVTVGADRFEIKTASGTIPVTFSSKTKFEHGDHVVDKSHLSKGEKVSVIGTKLPTGELVAKEVLLGVKESDPKAAKETKAKSEHKH